MGETAGLTTTNGSGPEMIPPPVPTDWEVRWHPAKHAKVRLVCLPHAGGGSVAYQAWAVDLAPDIEVVAIRLPGRE